MKKDTSNKIQKIISVLESKYGSQIGPFLNYKTDFQLLVAVILSTQTTDKIVNKVTLKLFEKYPDALSLSKARLEEIERLIKKVNFYKTKARNIKFNACTIIERFNNKIPTNIEDLMTLRGIGRKVANIVLYEGYGILKGIAVDTHVARVSFRIGLTNNIKPNKIEEDLQKLIPQKYWGIFPKYLILIGREYCTSRRALCQECPLNEYCPKLINYPHSRQKPKTHAKSETKFNKVQ